MTWLVPDDWGGIEYEMVALCVPDSPKWKSIVNGAISQMANAYSYDRDTGDVIEAKDIGLEVFNSMSNCNDIAAAINAQTQVLLAQACGCPVGQGEDTGNPVEGGPVPDPIGEIVYQEPSAISDRECKAANLVHQNLLALFTQLDAYNVDDMGTLGLALTVGIVGGIIGTVVASPLAGIMVAVAGSLAIFAAKLIGVTLSLADIVTAMTDRQYDLVCALYNSDNGIAAAIAYLDILDEEIGIGVAELALVELVMSHALMATLYFDTPDLAAFWPTYTGPVDCSSCGVLDTDWVLLPNDRFNLVATADGTLGTGVIDNGGGSFTITASQRTDPASTRWAVGILTQGFLDSQPGNTNMDISPSGTKTGTITRTSTLPSLFLAYGRYSDVCVTVVVAPPLGPPPQAMTNAQFLYYEAVASFSVTFTVDTPPVVC